MVEAAALQAIYVKAQLQRCHSVLMGEAAALALGASIVQALQISHCNFLSDSQQLVHFLHQENQQNPFQWRIKPFTQVFTNIAATIQSQLFKINRNQNTTADILTKQARSSMLTFQNCNCTRPLCGPICTLFQALLQVDLNSVSILAASCCG